MPPSFDDNSMPRDLASAYLATAARVASWVIVSAMVYRMMSAGAFAMLTLVRSTIGLLNYATVGLAPAMIHLLAKASAEVKPAIPVGHVEGGEVLSYAGPGIERDETPPQSPLQRVYYTALTISIVAAAIAVVATNIYADRFDRWLDVSQGLRYEIHSVVFYMGLGVVFRMASDAPSAVLQTRGHITLDNALLAASELLWVILTALWITRSENDLPAVGHAFAASGAALLASRVILAEFMARALLTAAKFDWVVFHRLVSFGSLVMLSQLAGYLYAPTDYILINKLLGADLVAVYAPAVQIDAGLLLLVSGLAAVLLPKSALAHAAGDTRKVRRYYARGTLVSAAILIAAGVMVWVLSPWIFRFWLGDEMPATQRILPLVLIHTTIGGSAMVGRSILLAMGRVGPYTTATLSAAVLNVIVSYCAVRYFNLGLNGVILGTITAATLSNGIWLPWYVMRSLRTSKI